MKKLFGSIFCVMLIMFLMCSCTDKEIKNTGEITIGKNDILRSNLKTKLAEKYGSVYEVATYKFADGKEDHSWYLYYEKTNDSYNAALIDGAYECYYYDNGIYFTTENYKDKDGNPEYRNLIYLNERYDSIVESLLVDDSILKSVFFSGTHAEQTPDGGYIATFDYIATNEVAQNFALWEIEPNQKMSTVYNLNKDYEINKVKYYKYAENEKVLIGEVDYFYGDKATFPEDVMNMHNSEDKVQVKIIQNYGTSSERENVYSVAKGTKISGNSVMMSASITKDAARTEKFDFESYIEEDTVLYASSSR